MTHPEFEFFHTLPKAPKPLTLLQLFAESLRDRPRVWGKWPVQLAPGSARVVPGRIKDGKYKSLPRGEFEAVRHHDGVVYVRYIGPRRPAPIDADLDETADEYDDAHVCDDNCDPGNCAVEHACEFDATLVRPGSVPDPDAARDRQHAIEDGAL
ncbi:hypothetical protein [Nocardia asiatica]